VKKAAPVWSGLFDPHASFVVFNSTKHKRLRAIAHTGGYLGGCDGSALRALGHTLLVMLGGLAGSVKVLG
jgi:hypothetical protein